MVKNILIIILITVLILLVYQLFFNHPPTKIVKMDLKGKTYQLEIAKTIPQQAKGLMNRTSLCQNCGMIFVFGLELPQAFWMKNTLIPLDIIFLDKNGKIINIVTATPQSAVSDNQLRLYRSTAPAKFVIELNAGDATKLSLVPDNIIDIPSL